MVGRAAAGVAKSGGGVRVSACACVPVCACVSQFTAMAAAPRLACGEAISMLCLAGATLRAGDPPAAEAGR